MYGIQSRAEQVTVPEREERCRGFLAASMADIALLVVEEFEKRTKRGAPGGGDDEASKSRRNFGAVMKVCGSWVESASAAASGVKVNVALLKAEIEEPKTKLGLAAFDGFFSA